MVSTPTRTVDKQNLPERHWGTVTDAADLRKVSTKTIRRLISSGDIYAERFGPRLIRVDLNSLATAGRPLQYVSAAV